MNCAISWSGGKDAYLALNRAREAGHLVTHAVTTFVAGRSSGHGLPEELIALQCQALGLQLHPVHFGAAPENLAYEAALKQMLGRLREAAGCEGVVFGDLFLEDIRDYREQNLLPLGVQALFPLWGEDTVELANNLVADGVGAVIICVNTDRCSAEVVGKYIDLPLLESLPPEVDPCGEWGEFHTFVTCGPGFTEPIPVSVIGYRSEGLFRFAELVRSG